MAKPITYCTVDGCAKRTFGHGLCAMHYQRMARRGSTDDRPPHGRARVLGPCSECGAVSVARNLCPLHYARWVRLGADRPRCAVEGCDKTRYCDNLCAVHYDRRRRLGRLDLKSREERFWEKVDRRGPDECWPWLAGGAFGYGAFDKEVAHRVSYELLVGPVPKGFHLHHTCGTRACVNPAHLEPMGAGAHTIETWVRTLRKMGYAVTPPVH